MSDRYQIQTYNPNTGRYTPQAGLTVPWTNLTKWQLREAMRELRGCGYECRRGDSSVLIERMEEA